MTGSTDRTRPASRRTYSSPLWRGPLGPVFPALRGAARALCFPLCRGPLGPCVRCYVPAVRMDDATRLEVFRQSLLSRRLEERVMSLAKAGEVPASLHMGAG